MAEIITRRDSGGFTVARVVWAILWVVNTILALRFILRLIGANSAAGFTNFIYTLSAPLLAPFRNIVASVRIANGGVFEWATLIAMVVYWLIAWGIVRIALFDRTTTRIERI
jgi:hypothetical protein